MMIIVCTEWKINISKEVGLAKKSGLSAINVRRRFHVRTIKENSSWFKEGTCPNRDAGM
jgi:hypothetical protein